MSLETPNTKHFVEGLVKLIPPLWGKPRVAAWLRSYLNRVQEFEDACWEVLEAYNVDTATGKRLDVLGKIVGQPRYGFTDATYRSVIKARIRAARSLGRYDDLLDVIRLATGITAVGFELLGRATLDVVIVAVLTDDQHEALTYLLPKTRAGGVLMHMYHQVSSGGVAYDTSGFVFADDDGNPDGNLLYDVTEV